MKILFTTLLFQVLLSHALWAEISTEEIVHLQQHKIQGVSLRNNYTHTGFVVSQSGVFSLVTLAFDDEGGVSGLTRHENQTITNWYMPFIYCKQGEAVNLTAFDPPLDWPVEATVFTNREGTRAIGYYTNDTNHTVEFVGRSAKEKKTRFLLSISGKAAENIQDLTRGSLVAVSIFNTSISLTSEFTRAVVVFDCQDTRMVENLPVQAQKSGYMDSRSNTGFYATPDNAIMQLIHAPASHHTIPVLNTLPAYVSIQGIHVENDVMLVNMRDSVTHENKFQFFRGPGWFEALGPAALGQAQFVGELTREDVVRGDQLGQMRYSFYSVHHNSRVALKTYMIFKPYFTSPKGQDDRKEFFTEVLNLLKAMDTHPSKESIQMIKNVSQKLREKSGEKFFKNKDIDIPTGLNIEPDWQMIAPNSFKVSGVPVHYWQAEQPKGLVLDLHGGPHFYEDAEDSWLIQGLLQQGYSYARPEPRGSAGYGHNHSMALVGRWNDVDVADVMSVVNHFKSQKNYENIFLTGSSYGGFLTAAVVSKHSDSFKGAVPMMGVYDLGLEERSYPTNLKADLDNRTRDNCHAHHLRQWRGRYGFNASAEVERDRAVSPVYSLCNVTIPLLLIHGQNDTTCYPNQFFRYYNESVAQKRNVTGVLLKNEAHAPNYAHTLKTLIEMVPKFFNAILSGRYKAPKVDQTYFEVGENYSTDAQKVIDSFRVNFPN